jgi:hypothetical protein
MIFNIYYINFPKVYEIKMMLSNIISLGKEIQKDEGRSTDDSIRGKLGASFMNLFSSEVEGTAKTVGSNSQKVLETFEIKTTKSIILNDLLTRSRKVESLDKISEGELVQIDDVRLSLVNDAELRTIKLFTSGGFKGMSIPGANGFDINNLFNSMFKDYAYKLKGHSGNSTEMLLVKIPLTFESEFESSYSVDDLFIGKVSVLGLYKGKVQMNSLKNSFEFFQELGTMQRSVPEVSEISESQYRRDDAKISYINLDSDKSYYHYFDLLSIVQIVKIPEPDAE